MLRSLTGTVCALALGFSAPAGALAADWATYGFDLARSADNTAETVIDITNAGRLQLQWSKSIDGGAITAQPIVATNIHTAKGIKDLLIVGTETGALAALDAANGKLVWRHDTGFTQPGCGDLPDGKFGITASALYSQAENRVYAMGGDGKLYAYRISDGEPVAGWPVKILPDASTEHVYGGLSQTAAGIYVATASMCDQNSYHGRIVLVEPTGAHPKAVHAFYVDGTTVQGAKVVEFGSGGGGIWGPGGVAMDEDGDVYVATGNLLNSSSEHDFYGDQVVKLDHELNVLDSNYPGLPDPEADVDFGSTPVLFKPSKSCPYMFAAINKDRLYFTYSQGDLASGPLQTLDNNSDVGDVAFDHHNRQIVVANLDKMEAWRYGPDCTATLAWSTPSSSGPGGELGQSISPPTVANGVVYYGNGAGATLQAFNARTGARLLKIKTTGSIFAAPTVVNGHVYVVDWAGKVYAFQPGP